MKMTALTVIRFLYKEKVTRLDILKLKHFFSNSDTLVHYISMFSVHLMMLTVVRKSAVESFRQEVCSQELPVFLQRYLVWTSVF